LLNTILGENMSSRLFQAVREERGLAYSIYSSLSYFDDVGTLTVSAGLDLDNLTKTLKLVMRELSQLTKTLVTSAEVCSTALNAPICVFAVTTAAALVAGWKPAWLPSSSA